MNRDSLAKKIEAQATAPDMSAAQVHALVAVAMQRQLAGVCVSPVWAQRVATMLRETPVPLCVTVGFPHGTSKSTIKAIEATAAAKDGADEIELVPHLANLRKQDVPAVRTELMEVVRAVRATGRDVLVRVVLEVPLLMRQGGDAGEAAVATACQAARESGCDMIVTSSGYDGAGAGVEAVRLAHRYAPPLPIKHVARVTGAAAVRELLDAGASRVGMADVEVIEAVLDGVER